MIILFCASFNTASDSTASDPTRVIFATGCEERLVLWYGEMILQADKIRTIGSVESVAFNHAGDRIAYARTSGSDGIKIIQLQLATNGAYLELSRSIRFSNSDSATVDLWYHLLVSQHASVISIWDSRDGKRLQKFNISGALRLSVHPFRNEILIATHHGGNVRFINWQKEESGWRLYEFDSPGCSS